MLFVCMLWRTHMAEAALACGNKPIPWFTCGPVQRSCLRLWSYLPSIWSINPLHSNCCPSFPWYKLWCLGHLMDWHISNWGYLVLTRAKRIWVEGFHHSCHLPSFLGDVAMVSRGGGYCERLSELLIWLFVSSYAFWFALVKAHYWRSLSTLRSVTMTNYVSGLGWLDWTRVLSLFWTKKGAQIRLVGWLKTFCVFANCYCLHVLPRLRLSQQTNSSNSRFLYLRLCELFGPNYILLMFSTVSSIVFIIFLIFHVLLHHSKLVYKQKNSPIIIAV